MGEPNHVAFEAQTGHVDNQFDAFYTDVFLLM